MLRQLFASIFSAALWLLATSVHAQDASEPADYRPLTEEAVKEFDASNYEEARALFARAHAVFPNARTHRGLGFVEFELRNYGECIAHLEAALKSEVKPLTDRLRTDTERVLARARRYVARVLLEAEPSPSRVLVDGVPVVADPGEFITLRVGDHTIELRTAGYEPEKRRLSLKGGEEHTLNVVFSRPLGAPVDAPPPQPAAERPEKHWSRSPWLWTAVGVLVAGAAGTGVGIALSRDSGGSNLPSIESQ